MVRTTAATATFVPKASSAFVDEGNQRQTSLGVANSLCLGSAASSMTLSVALLVRFVAVKYVVPQVGTGELKARKKAKALEANVELLVHCLCGSWCVHERLP